MTHFSIPDAGAPSVVLAGVNRGASEQVVRQAVRAAAEQATDFSWLSQGDAVFIKPAHNSGNPYPATTSPVALAAMVQLLKEKGAGRVIVGDMAGIEHVKLSRTGLSGSTRTLMERSGIARAAQAAGAELHFFEEAGWDAFYEDMPVAGSHWKTGLMMPMILEEVEHIVLMPRCSRHFIAGSTLGLKCAVGYWRTDTRLEYHRYAATLHEKTAEANTVETLLRKQRLVISAADKILATWGPDDGKAFEPEVGLVMASQSVVAHDMVSMAWLLENRDKISESEKNGFIDNSRLVAQFANYYVVGKLDTWTSFLNSEAVVKDRLTTIWDDPVLSHAHRVFGGVPQIALEASDKVVSEGLKKRLSEMVTPRA
jgi:uncharacterized protein (DUF362 family)